MAPRSLTRAEGQAVVELALTLPLILLLLFAITQVAFSVQRYQVVVHAAREGARFASVSRADAHGVADTVSAAKLAASDLSQTQLAVTVTPAQPWAAGQQVSVTVSYPYSIDIMGVVVTSGRLSSTSTAKMQ